MPKDFTMPQENQEDGLIRRSYGLSIRSIDEKRRSAHFVFSAATIDSYDEIVEQDWDLTRYIKNPVVLYNHNRGWGEPKFSLPIGRAENVGVVKGQLEGDVVFATEKANPFAEQCWQMVVEDMLRAGSVGFSPGDVRSEVHDGKDIYRLSKCKLFEFSLTPIGACEDALANSAGAQRDAEILKTLAAKTAARELPPTSGESDDMDPKQLQAEIERLKSEGAAATDKAQAAEKSIGELKAKTDELTAAIAAKDAEIAALKDAQSKAEGEAIAAEVAALVGKKIVPTQVDDYIELRAMMGKEKFAAFVAKQADIVLTQDITGKTPGDSTNTSTGRVSAASKTVLNHALEAASKAGAKFGSPTV